MSDEVLGKTTIAPEVLHTIARLTALGVDGVSRMATSANTINRVANKNDNEGVKIEIKDNTVFVDLFVILKSEENVRVVSKNIQQRVKRAINEMIGMDIAFVNIHIADIDFEL